MALYQWAPGHQSLLRRQEDGSVRIIPVADDNGEYQAFLAWDALAGNDPDPADPLLVDPFAQADADALAALGLNWVLGQARLQGQGAGSIQTQMDAIQADTITTLVKAAAHIKTLSEAVEDLSRQVFVLKRIIAIQAQVPDR